MTEWLVEEGIGEERAVLVQRERIVAARMHWPGGLTAGQVEDARLVSRRAGSPRGLARFASGEEALVDRLAPSAAEGSIIQLEVTRAKVWEADRRKLAQARPTDRPLRGAPSLAEQLAASGHPARIVRRFDPSLEWDELWHEAFERRVSFASGALLFHPTPAMTLIDVDGEGAPDALALEAAPAVAAAIRRFDLAGGIGVDFPTVPDKALRRAVDEALGRALVEWDHERTAMNGFGFVQLVARMARMSLLSLIAGDPVGAAARWLLRAAEALQGAGAVLLRCPPLVAAALRPVWLAELERRMGRPVRVEADERLDPLAGHAQLVPHE